ncbi:MAG: hypothetical protein ABI781_09185 [Burkholderiales bacterium]
MANDADWVADVRRWYFSSQQAATVATPEDEPTDEIGYEAAHPALQSRHWPDAPRPGFIDLK